MSPTEARAERLRSPIHLFLAAVCVLVALAGCGGDDGGGDSNGGGGRGSEGERGGAAAAEALCGEYRKAVAAVRFQGTDPEQAADFTAAAKAARAAQSGTKPGDLTRLGPEYLRSLATVAGAYERAASAKAKRDSNAFNRALDVGEPADDNVDGIARRGGLERCALGAVGAGEAGVSQSGFPALAVPKAAFGKVPPSTDNRLAAYPLDREEALLLQRGPKLPTGSVSADEAARRFEAVGSSLAPKQVGPSGNKLVAMRKFAYKSSQGAGTAHAFSGQGNLWLLFCQSRRSGGPSPQLERACDRAVATLGFLMF